MTTLLTHQFLANDTAAVQPAGFISPIFGLTFKRGDITTAPIFKINGVEQPYSWGLQSHYDDGSLRHASFMVRCSVAIPAKSTVALEVWSGGAAPEPSNRIFAEVAVQDLRVGGEGIGEFGGLPGEWWAHLAADTNNTEQCVYLDGQAGKTWRIKTSMAQTPDGQKHGQLEVYHYVTALTDGSGHLGGFRHLARINQPYYNLDTPIKALRAFKGIATWYGDGEAIMLPWPFRSVDFTTEANAFDCTVASGGKHNFYNGAQPGEGSNHVNCVPGYLSATTDPALSTSKIYFAYTYGDANNNKVFRISENTTGLNSQIVTQGGTGTFVPTPVCLHGGSIWTADPQGRSNFFQGTGSMAADSVVRTQFDPAYLHSTGAIPPLDLSLVGNVKDIPEIVTDSSRVYWANNPTWNPVTSGALCNSWRGGPGSVPDIGPLPAYACAHFYNQSVVADMAMRSMAFASDFDGTGAVQDVATSNYINVLAGTYAGMPAPSPSQQTGIEIVADIVSGFTGPSTPPAGNMGFLWGGDQNPSHKPSMAYYPFLIFGEPHFHDLMIEAATGDTLAMYAPLKVTNNPPGTGIVMAFSGLGLRGSTWALRDIMLAATFAADVAPGGSEIKKYLNDLLTNNLTYINAIYMDALLGLLNSKNSWRRVNADNASNPGSFPDFSSGGFMRSYFAATMAWGASLGIRPCLDWLNKEAVWVNFVIEKWGAYPLYAEYDGAVLYDKDGNITGPITDWEQWGITAGIYGSLTWQSTGTHNFTVTNPRFGYVVAEGDMWMFQADRTVNPGGLPLQKPLYAVGVSGSSFNLSLTKGGAPIIPTDSGELSAGEGNYFQDASSPYLRPASPPAASTGQIPAANSGDADGYLTYKSLAWNWAKAAGAVGYDAAIADTTARLAAMPPDFSTNATWAAQDSFASVPAPAPDPTPIPPPTGVPPMATVDLGPIAAAVHKISVDFATMKERVAAVIAAAQGNQTTVDPAALQAILDEANATDAAINAEAAE